MRHHRQSSRGRSHDRSVKSPTNTVDELMAVNSIMANSVSSRPLSPNGALPMIPPPEYTGGDVLLSSSPTSLRFTSSPTKSVSSPLKKVSFNAQEDVKDSRYIMKYDDDEFAFAAHLLLNRIGALDDSAVYHKDCNSMFNEAVDALWYFTTGEKFVKPKTAKTRITIEFISAFDAALKHRMKFVSYRSRPKEAELIKLTRDVARVIAAHGYPMPDSCASDEKQGLDKDLNGIPHSNSKEMAKASNVALSPPRREHFFPEHDLPAFSRSHEKSADESHEEIAQPSVSIENPYMSHGDSLHSQSSTHEIYEPGALPEFVYSPEFRINGTQPETFQPEQRHDTPRKQFSAHSFEPGFSEIYEPVRDPYQFGYEVYHNDPVSHFSLDEFDGVSAVGYFEPDRSFEAETVVVREIRASPELLDTYVDTPQGIDRRTQAQNDAVRARQLSIARQKIVDETMRVKLMLSTTTNDHVKLACFQRLEDLRHRLLRFTLADHRSELLSQDEQAKLDRTLAQTEDASITFGARNSEATFPGSFRVRSPYEEVEVVAPADLTEDFQFDAQAGDRYLRATVPSGGVKKGEVFKTYLHNDSHPKDTFTETTVQFGHWKDGLGNFLVFGPFHPMLCNGIFCPLLALSQVMTRINASWIGFPSRDRKPGDAFRMALVLSMAVLIGNCLLYYLPCNDWNGKLCTLQIILLSAFNGSVLAFYWANVARTRRRVRKRFMIQERECSSHEDFILSFACSSCVVMQMGRHTADYETYNAVCCTQNGLPSHLRVELPPSPDGSTLDMPFKI